MKKILGIACTAAGAAGVVLSLSEGRYALGTFFALLTAISLVIDITNSYTGYWDK